LEFLYTGIATNLKKEEVVDLIMTANLLDVKELATVGENILNNTEDLNPSIGTSFFQFTREKKKIPDRPIIFGRH
jgi:hypothetical protein